MNGKMHINNNSITNNNNKSFMEFLLCAKDFSKLRTQKLHVK